MNHYEQYANVTFEQQGQETYVTAAHAISNCTGLGAVPPCFA